MSFTSTFFPVKAAPDAMDGPNQLPDPDSGKEEGPPLRVALIVQGLLCVPWLPLAALSAMAYDSGKLWPGVLIVGPFQAYPLLVVAFLGAAALLKESGKLAAATWVAWLAPAISFGSLGLYAFVGSALERLVQPTGR